MTMPAQFPHPEPPNSSVKSIRSDSSSPLRSGYDSSYPDQDFATMTNPLAETMAEMTDVMAVEMAGLRQAAQRGEFRAIATLLNQTLHRHDIVAWVGEAGPGCLQITLTVKRPPQPEALMRFIAHQLCLLQSDVILGANLTARLAATNLILWHKLVRLPSRKPTPPPAADSLKEKLWPRPVQAILKLAGQRGRSLLSQGQPMVRQVWQRGWPQVRDGVLRQYEKVRSLPSRSFQPSPQPSEPIPASPSSLPSLSATVPPNQTPIMAAIDHSSPLPSPDPEPIPTPTSRFQADTTLGEKTPPPLPSPSLTATDENQWTELAMLPVAWSEPAPSKPSATAQPGEGATTVPTASPQIPVDPSSAHQQPAWLTTLDQVQTTLQDQIAHPNYWVMGGVAIAVFAMGGGFEAVNQYVAIQTQSGHRSVEQEGGSANGTDPALPPDPETDGSNPPISMVPPDDGAEEIEGLSSESPNRMDTHQPILPPRPDRGSTVQTAVGEVDVITLAPVTPNPATVTLTFSNDAIVPPPPPETADPPKWQWPFTPPADPPIFYPADMAIALLSDLPRPSGENGSLSLDLLQRGGVNLVSLASNTIASVGAPALANTLPALDARSIAHIGIGADKTSARRPQIFDIRGHRIAVLGYADTHLYAASDTGAGTNALALGRLIEDIETIRDQVDWVIVTYHWHGNLSPIPTEQQIEIAHLAIDQGADVVVGHHPDVMQGGEVYKGRAIAYSLGPVSNPGSETPVTRDRTATAPLTSDPSPDPPEHRPQTAYTTALLKLEVSDRAMQVGFLPVYQEPSGASFLDEAASQPVFQAIEVASQSLTLPLTSRKMTHLPRHRDVSSLSPADPETDRFSPNNTDSFIGPGPNTD